METYILNLTSELNVDIEKDLKEKGIWVTWKSNVLPHIISVESGLTKEELGAFEYIKNVHPSMVGTW